MRRPTNMALGQPLGPYILTERLGVGGLAEVYRAERPLLDNRLTHVVAIKRLHKHLASDTHAVEHLIDEARLALRLQHPNIAQIYEVDQVDDAFFLVMELVQGHPLTRLQSKLSASALALPAALFIVREAASALAFAHSLRDDNGQPLNIVHLDISPDNLLITHHGHVKLIDFGLASAREQLASPHTARMRGRARYLSPERAQGLKFNHQADLFSLGLILLELLTGESPLSRLEPLQAIAALQAWTPPNLVPWSAGWPPPLGPLLAKLLAARPSDRTPNAQSLCDALTQILHALPVAFDHAQLRDLLQTQSPPPKTSEPAHSLQKPQTPPALAPLQRRVVAGIVLGGALAFAVGLAVGLLF